MPNSRRHRTPTGSESLNSEISEPFGVDPEIAAVAQRITDSIEDVAMANEIELLGKQIENTNHADELRLVSPLDDSDQVLRERISRLQTELANVEPFPGSSLDLIADPLAGWSKQFENIQTQIEDLNASDPFHVYPF